MDQHPDYGIETEYLEDVLHYLQSFYGGIITQKEEIDALVSYGLQHYNSDNPEQFIALVLNTGNQEALAKKVAETRYALNKPYFARVDFTPDDEKKNQRHYIGKMTLMRDLNILITDWRAPVSSLYYEGRIGSAAYDCPDGNITGEITLKRQYAIEQGQLRDFTDIDITTNDAFLQASLGASKDKRLKDIVTTIQAEQNKVIRAPLFSPLLVQGVAGGGKTTIALHRIAYLLYTHEKSLLPNQVMIMAPNRFFLSYISEVLPDLGVERVTQTTFEDFVSDCIQLDKKKFTLNPAVLMVAEAVNNHQNRTPAMQAARLKSGLRFKALIERYCRYLEKQTAPKDDFVLEGYELFTHEALSDLFLREYAYLPVARRAAEIKKHLSNTLKKEKPLILKHIEADYDGRREALKRRMPDSPERRTLIIELHKERDALMTRVKNKSKSVVSQFMQAFKMQTVMEYYKALLERETWDKMTHNIFKPDECAVIANHTRRVLAEGHLDTEDLPPVLLMQLILFGLEDALDIKHIVIDEAQDFSLFQFSVLKQLTKSDSFSILGDLHQGIYAYKGVQDWSGVWKHIFNQPESQPLTLEQSYRTTVEIMDAANTVIGQLYRGTPPATPLAKPVIRHGSPVEMHEFSDLKAVAAAIDKKIIACQQEGYHSIAIIGKTLAECDTLRKLLKTKASVIRGNESEYEGGLLIVPSYLVKGLEFDAVIVANASEQQYKRNDLDIKLLYIAMTRALHNLTIYADGFLSELLDKA